MDLVEDALGPARMAPPAALKHFQSETYAVSKRSAYSAGERPE
jgi:hypothetical protein